MFHDVWESERFQTAKVTFKVIQTHWQRRGRIDLSLFSEK